MKKIKILTIITLTITLLLSGCTKKEIEPFLLTEKYYEKSEFIDLDAENLNTLIKNKENFAIFVYQPLCEASTTFNNVLTEFIDTYKMGIYKIEYKNIKKTPLEKHIKYYPSLVIYQNGKIIDFLEADKDEDTKSFKNLDDFINWFSKYVIINQDEKKSENGSTNEENINNSNTQNEPNFVLKDVTYNENKVNIYLFWGDGCPHCEKEKEFFDKIEKEYGEYYILHKYEVWHNDNNQQLLENFANKMGDDVSGVPYTIIGNQTFKGFSESVEEEIINAITSQYKNSYDIYFDKNN